MFVLFAVVADNHFKSDVKVRLDWLHFNTARIIYDEHHEITYYPQQNTLGAVSHETLTAVKAGDSYRLIGYEVEARPSAGSR